MGPFLKFLTGVFLVVWIAIGIIILAGGTLFATQLPHLIQNGKNSLNSLQGEIQMQQKQSNH